jgi:hypothetical protein
LPRQNVQAEAPLDEATQGSKELAVDSLQEALQSEVPLYGGNRCATCIVVKKLSDEDSEELVLWLADESNTSMLISRGLAKYGFVVSGASISRHRRGHNG